MPSSLARHWALDPEVHFLNHGSFGACPTAVLDAQQELRATLERQPVLFMAREIEGRIDQARAELASFLKARAEDLVFVPNATTGVNSVLRSMDLKPGDELLVTNQGYNACNNAAEYVASRSGAKVVVADLPFPLADPAETTEAILAAVTDRTRLAILDHITSPTGLVLPIEEIVAGLKERGVESLVDGAHAIGMLDVDLERLGAAYYTGNCHKWICTPKGSAMLWVRSDLQGSVRPAIISHGANTPRSGRSRFQTEFDWCGTDDPTPFLCIPKAIEVMGALFPGGWSELRERNHRLALEARDLLCSALEIAAPAPDSMIGSLCAVPIPDASDVSEGGAFAVDALQSWLYENARVEVPIHYWPAPPLRVLRISVQAYNDLDDFRVLADALRSRL